MSFLSDRTRVVVLRGGPSREYDLSLKSGAHILSLLREMPDIYDPVDIFISKAGEWHTSGLVAEPHQALRHADIVWNALHGAYGEDGKVQSLLEAMRVPYTGSGTLPSTLAMNKEMAKKVYTRHSLLTPRHELLHIDEDLYDRLVFIFRTYLHPVVVKPASSGSSIGLRLAQTFEELKEAVAHAFDHADKVLVEEFIKGKEASCSVVENARGETLYALVPIATTRRSLTTEENKEVESMARMAHEALGLRHYSESDFIIAPKGKVYILETNSLPSFTPESHMPKALQAVGWKPRDFVDHILKQALA